LHIHFTVEISSERAAPLAEKNAAARHHLLRSLISLHNEHPMPPPPEMSSGPDKSAYYHIPGI
jgi:hypothetical protein